MHRVGNVMSIVVLASIGACGIPPAPAGAGLFTRTPPPAHKASGWDWTASGRIVTSPPYDGITAYESCRWVSYDAPYQWEFGVRNDTNRTLTFSWGRFEFAKGGAPLIDPAIVHPTTLKPGASEFRVSSEPLGCPNMRGGQSDNHYYYVIGDHIKIAGASGYLRDGFFTWWNREARKVAGDKAAAAAKERATEQAVLDSTMSY